ncbi:MAG: Fic family protein [Bacteroidetes bacterium]|nr:Fic family protein [Bacteroidota bacterium]MBL0051879.1 Fic family protein [Bacteroidota bacterium]
MELLPVEIIQINEKKIAKIDNVIKSIYRLIIYSRHHLDDDLLDIYLDGMHNLKDLVGIKNAQMEAQNEEEAKEYLLNLKVSLDFVIEEIILHNNFEKEIQLFQLLRLVSPETNAIHPNRYRQTLVQIGAHICPEPKKVPQLVSELFYKMQSVSNPIIKAIYFHHELIRIHPFVDGNGRVTRVAKNWMLMYDLYPPIFINDAPQKKEYISTLANSFKELMNQPNQWNNYTSTFFEQELDRLLVNATLLYESINLIGKNREKNLINKI